MEEVIAELSAAFPAHRSDEPRADHAQYLDCRLAVMKADKKSVFTAASKASELQEGRLFWILLGLSRLAVRDDFLRAPSNGLGNGLAVLHFEGSEAGDRLREQIERLKLGEGFPEGLTPGESVFDVGHLSFADFTRRSADNTNVDELALTSFYCCNRFPSVNNARYLITLSTIDTFAEQNLEIGVSSGIRPV